MATLDDATFDAILEDVAMHGELRKALRAHGIHDMQFYRWIRKSEPAADRYRIAKSAGCNKLADELLALQDQKPPMVATQFGVQVDKGWVQWQRNRIDTRKWLLSHLMPRVYGERTVLAGDPDNPLAFVDADAATARSKLLASGVVPGDAAAGPAGTPGDADQ